MRRIVLLFAVLMFSAVAFAGDVQFQVTYDFSKNSPCASPSSNLCVFDILVFDTLTGQRRVDATLSAPSNATSSTTMTSQVVTLKDVYGSVTFYAVARARDASGVVIESNPTSAPSVSLVPGAPVSISVSVK